MSLDKSFKRAAMAGMQWNGLSTLVSSAFQSIQVAALSYFLPPRAFGIMAMAMVVIGFAQAFNDIGLSNAIIQRQDINIEKLSSLYWLQIVIGCLLFIIILLITPMTAQFFNEPKLIRVMALTSLIFLVAPVGQIFQILMQKGMEFKSLAIIDIASSFVSMLIAIILAFLGFGVMALVLGQLVYNGARSILFFFNGFKRWRIKLHFKYSDLKGFLSFGLYQMGDRTVSYFSINILNLIIGKFLGPYTLGLYSMAYQLIITPILRVSTVILTVSFPILSKLQYNNVLLKEGYLYISRLISFIIHPILLMIIVTAPVFVPAFLGHKWTGAVPMIQILSIEAMIRSLSTTTVPTYLAKGKADFGFRWNLTVAVMNSAVFYFIASYGIIALAWSFVCLSFIQFIILQLVMGTLIEMKLKEYALAIIKQILISIAMAFIVYISNVAIGVKNLGEIELLAILFIIGFISYALMNMVFNRKYLMELKSLIFYRKKSTNLP